MPVGSGLGTFVSVYALFEKPEDTMVNAYANHAHNDYLELWLETGIPGMALAGCFLAWFFARVVQIWKPSAHRSADIDVLLCRAAALSGLLILVHSFVDYPLRTSALMGLFAFICAVLADPPGNQRKASRKISAEEVSGHEKASFKNPGNGDIENKRIPSQGFSEISQDGSILEEPIDWPEAWRRR